MWGRHPWPCLPVFQHSFPAFPHRQFCAAHWLRHYICGHFRRSGSSFLPDFVSLFFFLENNGVCVCVWVSAHERLCVHAQAHVCVCVCIHARMSAFVCMHKLMCVCVCVCACVCMNNFAWLCKSMFLCAHGLFTFLVFTCVYVNWEWFYFYLEVECRTVWFRACR